MRKSDWKNWGAILSALIVAGSLVLDGVGFLPNVQWQFIALAGFVFFVFIMLLKLRYLQNEIDDIKNERPRITVKPEVYYGKNAILKIHNEGAYAIFTATARVIKGIIEPNLLNLYWEAHPNDATCPINKWGTKTILVAEISPNTEENDNIITTVFKGGIALYQLGGKRIGVCDYQMVEDAKLRKRYPTMLGVSEIKHECEIEVTITSVPQLSKPFEGQRYLIKIDYEHNGNLIFIPASSSDKESSQNQ